MRLEAAIWARSRVRRFKGAVLIVALSVLGWAQQTPLASQKHQTAKSKPGTIEYRNREYGFSFTLPESWKGYRVVWSEWGGNVFATNGEVEHELRGPKFLIRHPKWTQENPHEDIPVMIYTIAQWNEGPIVSAAPIDPWELGRNSKYVFVVPPRWDYDFSEGYEEAEKILSPTSLHTFEPAGK